MANDFIRVELDDAQFQATMHRLIQKVDNKAPLYRKLSGTMETIVTDNFRAGGRPAWLPVPRQGKPLNDTGHLKNSITASHTADEAIVGTNVEYAAIHHFGGKTRPHKIKPKSKQALAFNGIVVKSVNHPGSEIPARPFMVVPPEAYPDLIGDVTEYLRVWGR